MVASEIVILVAWVRFPSFSPLWRYSTAASALPSYGIGRRFESCYRYQTDAPVAQLVRAADS